jgi:membrane associated rhomboid family serine protease
MCLVMVFPLFLIIMEIGIPEIDVYGHIGGLIVGFLCGYSLAISIGHRANATMLRRKQSIYWLSLAMVVSLVLFYIL